MFHINHLKNGVLLIVSERITVYIYKYLYTFEYIILKTYSILPILINIKHIFKL